MKPMFVMLLASLGVHTAAHGYTAQACVKVQVSYFDSGYALTNGVKEDYWQTQTYYRPPYGAKYKLMRGIFVVSEGYLGDGFDPNVPAGCTQSFNVSIASTHTIYLWSEGKVQSNDLFSQNHQRNTRTISGNFIPPAGQSDVLIVPTGIDGPDTDQVADLYAAYVAGSFALYRHAGGEVGNQYFFFRCSCNDDCTIAGSPYPKSSGGFDCGCTLNAQGVCGVNGNASNAFNGAWRVSSMVPFSCDYKFLLIHELGHQMAQNATNGVATGGDCSLAEVHPCESTGHAMWSLEQSKCAANEGFAHFYAADVWNSHGQQDCSFKYYKWNEDTQEDWADIHGPMIDCAADDGPDPGTARDDFTNGQNAHPAHPMEASWIDKCNVSPLTGRGTEVDWMRVFWGVHTDGAAPPSFTTIASWIRDCGTLGNVSAYQDLDECADARPGDSLEVNWNANVPATAHNIDQ